MNTTINQFESSGLLSNNDSMSSCSVDLLIDKLPVEKTPGAKKVEPCDVTVIDGNCTGKYPPKFHKLPKWIVNHYGLS